MASKKNHVNKLHLLDNLFFFRDLKIGLLSA